MRLRMCSAGCGTPFCSGWPRPSTAWSRAPRRCSRLNLVDGVGLDLRRPTSPRRLGSRDRPWQEKRGEIGPEDLSENLLVQFGGATEELNRRWFERETGHSIGAVQHFVRHPKRRK